MEVAAWAPSTFLGSGLKVPHEMTCHAAVEAWQLPRIGTARGGGGPVTGAPPLGLDATTYPLFAGLRHGPAGFRRASGRQGSQRWSGGQSPRSVSSRRPIPLEGRTRHLGTPGHLRCPFATAAASRSPGRHTYWRIRGLAAGVFSVRGPPRPGAPHLLPSRCALARAVPASCAPPPAATGSHVLPPLPRESGAGGYFLL